MEKQIEKQREQMDRLLQLLQTLKYVLMRGRE